MLSLVQCVKMHQRFCAWLQMDLINEMWALIHIYIISPVKDIILWSLKVSDMYRLSSVMVFPVLSTYWGLVTHKWVQIIIGSDNGLSPDRRQAINWTNAGILLIGRLGTNVSKILIEIHISSFKKMHLKMSSRKWRPFWIGLNMLRRHLIF